MEEIKSNIGKDGKRLLTVNDTLEGSQKYEYIHQVVVLNQNKLNDDCKMSENQLYRVTHGPATKKIGYSDTVHIINLFDGDTMAVSRNDILGIVKNEVEEEIRNKVKEINKTKELEYEDFDYSIFDCDEELEL